MENLQVIEQNGMRVLTTTQLAEVYGVDSKRISYNFNYNSNRYTEGKHFIVLQGKEKADFLESHREFQDSLKFSVRLYLWTEKGAWLHAKSLNTDQAWDAYEMLVDDYYVKQQQVRVLSEREQLMASMKLTWETAEEMATVKEDIVQLKDKIENQWTIDSGQQRVIENAKKKRVYFLWETGVVNRELHDTRHKVFAALGRDLKDAFAVNSYRDILKKDFEEAVNYINFWRPRTV
ncbi:ORF6C domain-containing protein [Priestia megaterium]|uniref:ORF6N domain-containing protein n=1 Tax=Priestia megaterium TaxID=1404 RepID=UPI002E226F64|nr:ORF6C domain-containing protein [Priestia megaterium]